MAKGNKKEKAEKPVSAANTDRTIKSGDDVSVDYEGRFDTGEVFDSSKHGDHSHPLEFKVGAGDVIPGFDNAVIGMKIGEEKEFTIKPEDGYGEVNHQLKKEIPRKSLPPEQEPQVGMSLVVSTPQGQFPVKIAEVNADVVTIDLNHPLAGKTLIFKIKILEIK